MLDSDRRTQLRQKVAEVLQNVRETGDHAFFKSLSRYELQRLLLWELYFHWVYCREEYEELRPFLQKIVRNAVFEGFPCGPQLMLPFS